MVQAIYLGKTTDQFTQGTAYPIQGYADSIGVLLDDKNLIVGRITYGRAHGSGLLCKVRD